MIYPFNYSDDDSIFKKENSWVCIPENQECTQCGELVSQYEKSIRFSWSETAGLYLHLKCAEQVALMIMREVAEARVGPEIADATYQELRDRYDRT
jgi:hypothetical protein